MKNPGLFGRKLRPLAMVVLTITLLGCDGMDSNVTRFNADVQRVSIGEPYALSAAVLASAMVQAGFSADEVLKFGPKVRNAIASAGGAQINDGQAARAIMSIHNNQLIVSSRKTGTFIRRL